MHFDEGTDDLLGPILKTSALPIFLLHILLSVAYASWVREKRADASGRSLKAASCSSERDAEKKEGAMHIGAALVADGQSAKPMQPGERAFKTH